MPQRHPALFAAAYFLLATLITWWAVRSSAMYSSQGQQLLSTAIAGGKWAVQIGAAIVFLGHKRWLFIRNIGLTCLVGSLLLVPYAALAGHYADSSTFFIASLVASVVTMVVHYKKSVLAAGVNIAWWYGWLLCLGVAVTLQLTMVFNN